MGASLGLDGPAERPWWARSGAPGRAAGHRYL